MTVITGCATELKPQFWNKYYPELSSRTYLYTN